MNIREIEENNEKQYLSKYAFLTSNSKGRPYGPDEDDIRTCFQRDRDRIIHSKEFRRLKHKTQVFSNYGDNDHLRTRLIHTLEVTQVARTIARALRLNEDLVEAIAMGHDIGHCAFSHSGERVLNELFDGFHHSENSARLATKLNLTYEVIDGIRAHSDMNFSSENLTLEAKIVCYSDKIAYLNSDMDDGIRMKLIKEEDIPNDIREVLGESSKERLNTMVRSIINESKDKNDIVMASEVNEKFKKLRDYMFKKVYFSDELLEKESFVKRVLTYIYNEKVKMGDSKEEILDFMAGMTDSYAVEYYKFLHFYS